MHVAARLLPKERLKHGDYRVVPDLYSPQSSHRWFGIIVGEKTDNYSRSLKRALTLARFGLILLPFSFIASAALFERIEATDNAGSRIPVIEVSSEG